FLQIHRCYAVNPMHITAFTHEYVELTNGERLYISRALRNEIRGQLMKQYHVMKLRR
ncbi:MAG: LytTR family transcriptional regulator, partial [Oscillospiraceae bacterium]|nr:LytTR family transcriptional regulator [Oscillospiraceae bacterium]